MPDALWFPPLIETLIAVTIVYMALENIVTRRWDTTPAASFRGAGSSPSRSASCTASAFRSRCARSLQFAGDHLLTSLLAFNVGVEIGQIAVLLVLIPALGLLFRYVVPERLGIIILSALVAHTAWHWMLERGERAREISVPDARRRLPRERDARADGAC